MAIGFYIWIIRLSSDSKLDSVVYVAYDDDMVYVEHEKSKTYLNQLLYFLRE